MKPIIIILLALVIQDRVQAVGSYQPVSVEEHLLKQENEIIYAKARIEVDKRLPNGFVFLKVESVEVQIVSGRNFKYRLTYENQSEIHTYEVVVYEQSWNDILEVTKIELIDPQQ
ncbi:hypothetical protein pb186bvf_019281 [Paramecium bursaria]